MTKIIYCQKGEVTLLPYFQNHELTSFGSFFMMAKPCAGKKRRNPVSVPIVPTAQHGFKADNLAARRWREDANSWCRRNWVPATHEGQATRDDLLLSSSSCPPPPTTDVRRFLAAPDCRSTASASRRRVDGCPDLFVAVTAGVDNTDLSAGQIQLARQ